MSPKCNSLNLSLVTLTYFLLKEIPLFFFTFKKKKLKWIKTEIFEFSAQLVLKTRIKGSHYIKSREEKKKEIKEDKQPQYTVILKQANRLSHHK